MNMFCVTDKLFCNRKSFLWPNYNILEKLPWKQKSWRKWKLLRWQSSLVYIFSYLDTLKKKKNCKHKEGRRKNFENKYHDVKVKSLKWQSTLMCIFS